MPTPNFQEEPLYPITDFVDLAQELFTRGVCVLAWQHPLTEMAPKTEDFGIARVAYNSGELLEWHWRSDYPEPYSDRGLLPAGIQYFSDSNTAGYEALMIPGGESKELTIQDFLADDFAIRTLGWKEVHDKNMLAPHYESFPNNWERFKLWRTRDNRQEVFEAHRPELVYLIEALGSMAQSDAPTAEDNGPGFGFEPYQRPE